jgi:hypothetical protein
LLSPRYCPSNSINSFTANGERLAHCAERSTMCGSGTNPPSGACPVHAGCAYRSPADDPDARADPLQLLLHMECSALVRVALIKTKAVGRYLPSFNAEPLLRARPDARRFVWCLGSRSTACASQGPGFAVCAHDTARARSWRSRFTSLAA